MKLLRQISYEVPEGAFEGTITDATLHIDSKNGKPRENLRLTIAVDPIPGDRLHAYKARADYWDNQPDGLFNDLFGILGSQIYELTDEDGNIIPECLSALEGVRVGFNIIHCSKPGFSTPFRRVVNLRPGKDRPGTLDRQAA